MQMTSSAAERESTQASWRGVLIAALCTIALRPWTALLPVNRWTVAIARRIVEAVACLASRPVRGCRTQTMTAPVPGEWVHAAECDETAGAVLLLHGSGYVFCSPRTHRGFASHVSTHAGLPVFVHQYRRAPEHRFPSAEDDAVAAYRWLLDQGYTADQVVVAGDSAGGHLAIALCARALLDGLPAPAGMVLFAPMIDPSLRTALADKRNLLNPLSPRGAKAVLAQYIWHHDVTDPRLSLLNAKAALPPLQVHYGTNELFRDEITAFARHVDQAGGYCDVRVWPSLIHGYWIAPRLLPGADQSLRIAGAFCRDVLTSARNASSRRENLQDAG